MLNFGFMASEEMLLENVDDDEHMMAGRRTLAYTISSPMSLRLRWAIKLKVIIWHFSNATLFSFWNVTISFKFNFSASWVSCHLEVPNCGGFLILWWLILGHVCYGASCLGTSLLLGKLSWGKSTMGQAVLGQVWYGACCFGASSLFVASLLWEVSYLVASCLVTSLL